MEDDDPLSAFARRNQDDGKKKGSPPEPPGPSSGESVFRTIDVSKMKAPLPAKAAVTRPVEARPLSDPSAMSAGSGQTTGAGKGLGFGVDLWASDSTTKRGDLFLSDAAFPVADDAGIFKATSASASAAPSVVGKTVRVGSELDDYKLDDLKVSERLLEREEELDFATFGKASHAVQLNQRTVIATVQAGRDKGDFELESSDLLSKLEAATLETGSGLYIKSASVSAAAPAPKVEVDLATMDLDSYIKEQSSGGGGGLFD